MLGILLLTVVLKPKGREKAEREMKVNYHFIIVLKESEIEE
jgi:hypothetical protein